MNMKILALLLICCFAISFGFLVNALFQQELKIEVTGALAFVQGTLIQPNGGGGDPVDGPGVPR